MYGTNYYRLSQTDLDGNIKYYDTKRVNYQSSKAFSAGILNNGNGQVSVIIRSENAVKAGLKVIDMFGKEVMDQKFPVSNGGVVKNLLLNPGVYIVVVFNDSGERISNKVVVR